MKDTSDFFRASVSSVLAALVALAILLLLAFVARVDLSGSGQWLGYVIGWPLFTAIYVGWGLWAYARLGPRGLRRVAGDDDLQERRPLFRLLGAGTTVTTITAAIIAVVVTIALAQQPDIRDEPVYVALTLLTVTSSWVLMVFSFGQRYLRLGAGTNGGSHLRFHFAEPARFTDYVTLAILVSAMAATVPAEFASRTAWGVVRTNVVIAFAFNSVIIAMIVSLLFGGLLK